MTATDESYFVSRSSTRHIIGIGPYFSKLHAGRNSALCGLSQRPDDDPLEPLRDCAFCQKEAAEARRKAAEAEALEQIRNGFAEACIEPDKTTAPADQILN
jgi:hypothetical protein